MKHLMSIVYILNFEPTDPLETGVVITDHIIYNPKNVSIQAYISNDDEETLLELETLYLSGASLKIRAENQIIDKVVIAGKPNEITGTVFDKTLYSINFKETQEVTPAYTELLINHCNKRDIMV